MSRQWPEFADAAIVLISTGLLAARQGNQLGWFWSDPTVTGATWLPLSLTVTAGFFGAFQPFKLYAERKRRPLRLIRERELLHVLGELVIRCQELAREDQAKGIETTVGLADLGMHIWRKGWGWSGKWPFLRRELIRLRTTRLGSLPAIRPVRFHRGKGVIGRCWKLNDEIIEDNAARYSSVQTEAASTTAPPTSLARRRNRSPAAIRRCP